MSTTTELLKKNMAAFSGKIPGLAATLETAVPGKEMRLVVCRRGLPVLNNRIAFHSLIDPEKEALIWASDVKSRLADGRRAAVFGFGMGYHIKALLDMGIPSVVVIEPDPRVIRVAFEQVDFCSYAERVTLITDEAKAPDLRSLQLVPHRPTVHLHRETYARWEKMFELSQGLYETVSDVMRGFEDNEHVCEFLRRFHPDEPASIASLTHDIPLGPLKDWQIIFLFMKELEEQLTFP